MKFALFLGCKIPSHLPAYEISARAVLARLGVTLVDLEFDCCGYPARNFSREEFALAAARNLALAGRAGLDVLTLCTCCYGTLRQAMRLLAEDAVLRARATRALAAEGLEWNGNTEVVQLLALLAQRVGVDAVAASVRRPRPGLRVAAQYGCHALRPSDVAQFDNPAAPTIFEALIAATGASPIDWPRRLDCCGDPLHQANAPLALAMAQAKAADAADAGADVLCTACPHCHLHFDAVQAVGAEPRIRPLLYTQLLGLAMGLPGESLGLPAAATGHFRIDNNQEVRQTDG